jgi:hypothetical protein
MAGDGDAKRAWVERVLGISFGGASGVAEPPAPPANWKAARGAWQQASEAVDGQISGLQSALRATGDPELVQIAEFGLNALTAGFKTKLMAALFELGDIGPAAAPAAARKAVVAVQGLKTVIASDPRVDACDSNPAGVAVSIRATLMPALDGLLAGLAV